MIFQQIQHGDPRPGVGQSAAEHAAENTGAAGDDGDLAVQSGGAPRHQLCVRKTGLIAGPFSCVSTPASSA